MIKRVRPRHTQSERSAKESGKFIYRRIDIFGYIVGLDMSCARDEEQFLVLRAGGVAETLLREVESVSIAACYHQQRLVDERHSLVGIKGAEVDKAALGVAESGVRMGMRLQVIDIPVAVEVVGNLAACSGVTHDISPTYSGCSPCASLVRAVQASANRS